MQKAEWNWLLEREELQEEQCFSAEYLENQVVLVTGGGGSIGSELCRQVAEYSPKQLIIVDIYENNVYEIQQELLRKVPNLALQVLIASVRDFDRMEQIFRKYRPAVVYHAAAHKHVPLMESSPNEAIKNNVMGTYYTAKLAVKYGASRFVLISSDKAVNPTNIMGASKRLCELVVQGMTGGNVRFGVVRFGNVMDSNGSVIPLFQKQIQEGGPITVTHPDVIRYFMTIPEAVRLVLEAGSYATTAGEIFVLDMGEPVKIDDLARNLIRLNGLIPERDIEICYTGLRPGEKLYEELLTGEEGLSKTENPLILKANLLPAEQENFGDKLQELFAAAQQNSENIFALVQELVPTYKRQGSY